MRIKKVLFLLLTLVLINKAYAAYDPLDIEAIKVINTVSTDINPAAVTQFNNINTTAVINSNTDVFSSVTSNGVVCAPGTYLVGIVTYQTTTSTNNEHRVVPSLEVTVDGVGTGIKSANGYLRNSLTFTPVGHDESSSSINDVVTLTSTSKIGFQIQGLAFIKAVDLPVGQSAMRIVRIAP